MFRSTHLYKQFTEVGHDSVAQAEEVLEILVGALNHVERYQEVCQQTYHRI
jgi:hypothetical protein